MNISKANPRKSVSLLGIYSYRSSLLSARTVAILGGESSGKSTLVIKLANTFLYHHQRRECRDYVFHLGGDGIVALPVFR